MVEPFAQIAQAHRPGPGRSQLERQRDPIKASADLHDRVGVVEADCPPGRRAFAEQLRRRGIEIGRRLGHGK